MAFAGYTDWRLPNYFELATLRDLEGTNPAISTAFVEGCVPGCTVLTCSCTFLGTYWTSTTSASIPTAAWCVDFRVGHVLAFTKTNHHHVRAVRGGTVPGGM